MLEFLGALLLIFLLFMAVLVWLGVKLARKVVRTARGFAEGLGQTMPGLSAIPDPRWARFSTLLDRRQREQARVARERIRAFLGERQSGSLDPHHQQLLISCEKRVPELIDTCLERCRTARPGERCDYAGATLERLVRIGEEAEAARSSIREVDDGRLLTMHHYFDAVASKDPSATPIGRDSSPTR
jgi:hypothetical protein